MIIYSFSKAICDIWLIKLDWLEDFKRVIICKMGIFKQFMYSFDYKKKL